MKLPRDISGDALVKGLRRVGYEVVRQKGDHVYLTTQLNGQHHVAVPMHKPIKIGTLSNILGSVCAHLGVSRQELLDSMKL